MTGLGNHTEGVLAYIGLGSNMDDPQQQIEQALREISELPQTRLVSTSQLYRTRPVGPQDQPDFVNGVCAVESTLAPMELLQSLQKIEQRHGRTREQHWGPRTLDLDILLYGNECISFDALQVPHPRMAERNFVLVPLADIAPELTLPDSTPIAKLLANCSANGIVQL